MSAAHGQPRSRELSESLTLIFFPPSLMMGSRKTKLRASWRAKNSHFYTHFGRLCGDPFILAGFSPLPGAERGG